MQTNPAELLRRICQTKDQSWSRDRSSQDCVSKVLVLSWTGRIRVFPSRPVRTSTDLLLDDFMHGIKRRSKRELQAACNLCGVETEFSSPCFWPSHHREKELCSLLVASMYCMSRSRRSQTIPVLVWLQSRLVSTGSRFLKTPGLVLVSSSCVRPEQVLVCAFLRPRPPAGEEEDKSSGCREGCTETTARKRSVRGQRYGSTRPRCGAVCQDWAPVLPPVQNVVPVSKKHRRLQAANGGQAASRTDCSPLNPCFAGTSHS